MKREQIERDFGTTYNPMDEIIQSIKRRRIKFRRLLEQVTMDKIGCEKHQLADFSTELYSTEMRTGKATCYRYYFRGISLGFESISTISYSYGLNDLKNTIDNIHSIEKKYMDELDKLQNRLNCKINPAW